MQIQRRQFTGGIIGTATAWPIAARAQPDRLRRIGQVRAGNPELNTHWCPLSNID
jgi:hypothetical protein